MRGEYGRLPAPVNEEVRRKVIGDQKVDHLPPRRYARSPSWKAIARRLASISPRKRTCSATRCSRRSPRNSSRRARRNSSVWTIPCSIPKTTQCPSKAAQKPSALLETGGFIYARRKENGMSARKRKSVAPPKRTTGGVDGYIIERNGEIRKLRQTIRCKYWTTLLIAIYIPIWIFAIACCQWQSPERWTQTEIVYSHLSRESIGIRRGLSEVLNTADGRKFVIYKKKIAFDDLDSRLNSGEKMRADLFKNARGRRFAGGAVGRKGNGDSAGCIHRPLGDSEKGVLCRSVCDVRNRNGRPDSDRSALVQKGACPNSPAEGENP